MKAGWARGVTAVGLTLNALMGQQRGTVTITDRTPSRDFHHKAVLPIRGLRELTDDEAWKPGRTRPEPGQSVLFMDGSPGNRLELVVDGFACYPSRWQVKVQVGKKQYQGFIGGCDYTVLNPSR